MGEMKVEHVLLFLVGAFLVYHMMKGCGRVEGMQDCSDCKGPLSGGRCLVGDVCTHALGPKRCNNKGGTWCPDHVDFIPGQTGPESPPDFIPGQPNPSPTYDTKEWCMEHTQNKLDAGLINTNDFWNYYRACQSEY